MSQIITFICISDIYILLRKANWLKDIDGYFRETLREVFVLISQQAQVLIHAVYQSVFYLTYISILNYILCLWVSENCQPYTVFVTLDRIPLLVLTRTTPVT